MERFICIHGHFYQPPRENPWLEAIEVQDSAAPYHDWNARITAECYAPNAASRILDGEGRIVRIVNNYSRISYNVGPTLLAWLEAGDPETYRRIVDADRVSAQRFDGHGSAIAQPYNHMIMPLATPRDRRTQVRWGLRDFEHRFGRRPEGMWLPETAVDLDSLDALAAEGIRFTILAPHQAARVRRLRGGPWRDVSGGRIDPTRPYQVRLPSGRTIVVFFYDGPISRAIAFEDVLRSGEAVAQRLASAFSDSRTWAQLVHIATDGETYGHHHRFGDMALAYALQHIEADGLARLTNYGAYLERFPPQHQVEIVEDTSWSCVHGVERWRSNCGCNTGGHPGWHQRWRGPLREALDSLRDTLTPRYEAAGLLRDPWAARDAYIEVILDRSPETVERFLAAHAARPLSNEERVRALRLLELERQLLLMYTSCGWFFDELSGIETTQVLMYAGRAIQLARELFGDGVEAGFLERLARAESNIPEYGDGRRIYERFVRPAMVTWDTVAAHYAIRSLFEPYAERDRVYSYRVEREDERHREAGRARLEVGRVRITSEITHDDAVVSFGALHLGDHTVNGGVSQDLDAEAYRRAADELVAVFDRADFPETIRALDRAFGESSYSLRSLFRDDQRRILARILDETLADAEAHYAQIYEQRAPLMRFLTDLDVPLPRAFQVAAEFVLNRDLRRAIEEADRSRIEALLGEARAANAPLDRASLAFALTGTIERLADAFAARPDDLEALDRLDATVALAARLGFDVNLWKPQNRYWDLLQRAYPSYLARAEAGDHDAQAWVRRFVALGARLWVHVDPARVPVRA